MRTKDRIFGLDVLRAIAIMTVLIGHIPYVIGLQIDNSILRLFFFDGVNIFFTLSGYLIGSILLKKLSKEEPSIRFLLSFWRDRWLRTLPAYYFVVIILIFIAIIKGDIFLQYGRYIVFLQNIKTGDIYYFLESWSLSVEEWFYLTTPVTIFIAVRFLPARVAIPLVVLIYFVAGNIIRVLFVQRYGIDTYFEYAWQILMTIPCRIDAVMFGVLGAYLAHFKFRIWTDYRNSFFWVGVLGFFVNHYYGVWVGFDQYVLYGQKQVELLFVLMTIPKLSTVRKGYGVFAKLTTFISTISYSLYLTHAALFIEIIRPVMEGDYVFLMPIYLLWAFTSAWCLYSTIERGGLRYRERLKERLRSGQQKTKTIEYEAPLP